MDWNDDDNKKEKTLDKSYVSCEEDYEVEYLAKKYETEKEIVKKCCEETSSPHTRKDVEDCIRKEKERKQNSFFRRILGDI